MVNELTRENKSYHLVLIRQVIPPMHNELSQATRKLFFYLKGSVGIVSGMPFS